MNIFQIFRRDLSRAVTLLEMVKRRESKKREQIELSKKVFEKRYECRDFSGQLVADILSNMARNARYNYSRSSHDHETLTLSFLDPPVHRCTRTSITRSCPVCTIRRRNGLRLVAAVARTTTTAAAASSRVESWTRAVCARRSGRTRSGNTNCKKTNRRPRRHRQWRPRQCSRRGRPPLAATLALTPIPYTMPVIILLIPHTNTKPTCILAINLAYPPLFLRPIPIAITLLI